MRTIRAGFLPLLDAAILIAARGAGFAEEEGIDLDLSRETSWANIRDRVSVGQFDVAHMLAPLPVAQNLGLSPLNVPLVAPFALGLGGNAITLSRKISTEMLRFGGDGSLDPKRQGVALKGVIAARRLKGLAPLALAVVHDFSGHAYELRYWLAASGINPSTDVSVTIVPPPLMSDALAAGAIDGYCVGEPWNSLSVVKGAGAIVTTKAMIWQSSPEKVLGLSKQWAEGNGELLSSLLRALHRAARWCGDQANQDRLVAILSEPKYVGVEAEVVRRGLEAGLLMFEARAANFPWKSHALWYFSQMVRWGQVSYSEANARAAFDSYRPDLYRAALVGEGVAMPGASSKIEGALRETTYVPASGGTLALGPDGFFDGVFFDPDQVEAYVKASPFYDAMHND